MAFPLNLTVRSLTDSREISVQSTETVETVYFIAFNFHYCGNCVRLTYRCSNYWPFGRPTFSWFSGLGVGPYVVVPLHTRDVSPFHYVHRLKAHPSIRI